MMRCFLALPLDNTVKKAVSVLQRNLSKSFRAKVKWVSEDNLHLTIKFWNSLKEDDINRISTELSSAVKEIPKLKFLPGDIGCFPNFKNPRVIWLGLEGNKEVLHNLYNKCEAISQGLGFSPEEKPFKPHITLARVKEAGEIINPLPQAIPALSEIGLETIVLYHSILTPRGPQYSILKEFALKG